ncbi:hypothetical protein DRN67_03990 [Candidatus Micrarchaeota archaeon]|nr:MAG: hypothetical protein DRN67_03990 [Candidatus Micrarchaeota archaeon]
MRERLEGIVPIEVVPFAAPAVLREISALSSSASIRKNKNSTPFKTDNGNYIIDAPLTVNSPEELEIKLNALLGVVENGIFSKADVILIGSENGCRVLKNERKSTYSPFSNKE